MKQSTYSGPRSTGKPSPLSGLPGTILRIIAFCIIPYVVINYIIFKLATAAPAFHVVVGPPDANQLVPVTFTIDSKMPVKEISIMMDEVPLNMTQTGQNTYSTTVDHNGAIEITMTNFNGNAVSSVEYVDSLDDQPPSIEEYSVENNILVFTVVDSQSDINFDSIYAVASDGTVIQPLYIDRENSHVSFQMRNDGLTIMISDVRGNESQTTLNLN